MRSSRAHGANGSYLSRLLLEQGYRCSECWRDAASDNTLWRLRELEVDTRVELIDGDMLDRGRCAGDREGKARRVLQPRRAELRGDVWQQPVLTAQVTASAR